MGDLASRDLRLARSRITTRDSRFAVVDGKGEVRAAIVCSRAAHRMERCCGVATRTNDQALRTWEQSQPSSVTGDAVWRLDCYRDSLYLLSLARVDVRATSTRSAS